MPSWATRGPDESRVVYLLSTAGESFARSGMNRAGPVGLINPRSLWAQMLRERDPEYRAGAELVVEVATISSEVDGSQRAGVAVREHLGLVGQQGGAVFADCAVAIFILGDHAEHLVEHQRADIIE